MVSLKQASILSGFLLRHRMAEVRSYRARLNTRCQTESFTIGLETQRYALPELAMDKPSVPEDLRRFVLTSIPSVPFLEALLLMRADPEQAWTRDTLARRLYVRDKVAEGLLDELCRSGMAAPWPDTSADAYCYRPREDALRERSASLAGSYR